MKLREVMDCIEMQTGISVSSCRRITTGWEYLILEINSRYIFRVPYSPDGWLRLRREVSLVNSLSGLVSVPLPSYRFMAHEDSRNFYPFAGYDKLEGVPCNPANFRTRWIEELGLRLGGFLSELHSVGTSGRAFGKLERQSPRSRVEALRKRHEEVRRAAYPLISRSGRSRSERVWSALLSELGRSEFRPALVHDDLMGSNILVDPEAGSLAGVLDWSDAKIADPAADFAGIMSVNRRLGEVAMGHYGGVKTRLRERAELYLQYVPLSEIAWGVGLGSKRIIGIGLNNFHRWTLPARPPPA